MKRRVPTQGIKARRQRRARFKAELFGVTGVAATGALIICIFFASSLSKLLLTPNQYASVLASVLVDLANQDRMADHVGTLKINPLLVAAAQAKANDMAAKGYFAHTSPDGHDSWYWFELAGYDFSYAGENLAVNFSDSSDVERAWMNSPAHRENVLDPHFTEIGIATAEGVYRGHPTTFVVQMFGTPQETGVLSSSIEQITSPKSAAEPAVVRMKTRPAAHVLGASAVAPQAQASSVSPSRYAPAWGLYATSPKTFMRDAYYVIGMLIIAGLLITTGLEWRWHHMRAVATAGTLLLFMCGLFFIADTMLFGQPIISATQSGAFISTS